MGLLTIIQEYFVPVKRGVVSPFGTGTAWDALLPYSLWLAPVLTPYPFFSLAWLRLSSSKSSFKLSVFPQAFSSGIDRLHSTLWR